MDNRGSVEQVWGEAHEWNKIIDSGAGKDALTGLPNYKGLSLFLQEQVIIAERYNRPLSVIMLDLNGFKNINDTAGHEFGNLALQAVAGHLRGADYLARYGGDEFALVLPETDMDKTSLVIKKILEGLNKYKGKYKKEILRVGASIGVAAFKKGMVSVDLLHNADELMYKAKTEGKKIPRQEWLLGSVAYRNETGQIVIDHYKRGEVDLMFEEPTIIAE